MPHSPGHPHSSLWVVQLRGGTGGIQTGHTCAGGQEPIQEESPEKKNQKKGLHNCGDRDDKVIQWHHKLSPDSVNGRG